jgi:siderophore synthetase component
VLQTKNMDLDEKSLWVRASEQVLVDLINALLSENILDIVFKGEVISDIESSYRILLAPLEGGELYFRLWIERDRRFILFPIKPSWLSAYQISRPMVVLVWHRADGRKSWKSLAPTEVMEEIGKLLADDEREEALPNLQGFLDDLRLSVEHTFLSMKASESIHQQNDVYSSLSRMEQLASYRDRPFHPTSRAKGGWNQEDYQKFSPEFGRNMRLCWVAVKRDHLMCDKGVESVNVADLILGRNERLQLEEAFDEVGISSSDYMAMPMHPWQMENIFPNEFKTEMERGICIPLPIQIGQYVATSSLRSLAPAVEGDRHIKLPIGVYSLGALRLMPTRYLINGVKGQRLIEQVLGKCPALKERVFLCDERKWWAFQESDGNLFTDKPGHLSCLIREYPSGLMNDERVKLIPMSALSVYGNQRSGHLFSQWLKWREDSSDGREAGVVEPVPTEAVLGLFREVSDLFVEIALMFACYGIMPEMHGQNVVLVVRDGRLKGLLLRDHDTVRLHLPWMEASEIEDPRYVIRTDTPNTLINPTPEDFISYFQTLGIQVNLYSIIDALSRSYNIDESQFWKTVQGSLKRAVEVVDFPQEMKIKLEAVLFRSREWPTKLLIEPLIKRRGSGGGSMPSGKGQTENPFRRMGFL